MEQHPKHQGSVPRWLSLVLISLDTAPVLGTLTAGSAVGYTPGEYSITTAETPSLTASPTSKAMPSTLPQAAVWSLALPMLATTATSGGVAGSLAGTIAGDGAMTITAGGARLCNRTSGSA